MYLKIVLLKAKAIGALSRLIGKGSGIVIAGRLIMALAPNAVAKLAKGKRIVLISGTNGKSTTSKLIAAALGSKYSIAHNHTGANLFSGIAAALGANPKAEVAVLEVDELVLPWAIEKTKPEMIVLLNLGRDQLDRLSEVRIVSSKWRTALAANNQSNLKVLASSDDPFVVYAAKRAKSVIWFSAGERGHIDGATCPECGALLNWSNSGESFKCNCGFTKPTADWNLVGNELIPNNQNPKNVEVKTSIPGKAALQNAARALIVAEEFGLQINAASKAIADIKSVDGRFAVKQIGQTNFRLLLSKNPASWRETLQTSSSSNLKNVLLVVNANTQDGKDTSWLWDVDFKVLAGRNVIVTGDRRIDVAARLTVDGISHQVVTDELAAAKMFGASDADLIASYTAFHRLANK
ncbi:MAG: MurT ligase domain-containing protein [Candidatus Nanopelagicaceae bacterium]